MLINNPKELATFVKERRQKLKLNQAAIGKSVGVKQQTVSNLENNPEFARLATLYKVLSSLGLELHLIPKEEALKNSKWSEEW